MAILMSEWQKARRCDNNGKFQITHQEYSDSIYHGFEGKDYIEVCGSQLWPACEFVIVDEVLPCQNKFRTTLEIKLRYKNALVDTRNTFQKLFENVEVCESITKREDNNKWEYTQNYKKVPLDAKLLFLWNFVKRNMRKADSLYDREFEYPTFSYNGPDCLEVHGMRGTGNNFVFVDGNELWLMNVNGHYVD